MTKAAGPTRRGGEGREASPGPRAATRWGRVLPAVVLAILVLAAYLPVLRAGFIWDDDQYVTTNPTLRTADGLARIWADPTASPQYYPLTLTTFWAEYHLWGASPLGYHVVNVLLHAASVLLLWRILLRLKVPGAWFAAALWGIHPLQVESVAWVTERKNVLSGLLYLAAAAAYLRAARAGADEGTLPARPADVLRRPIYFLSLVLFAGALLSKTVACTLPAALLLVTWWKRGRLSWRDIVPLLPFFVLGLAGGAMTSHLERTHVGATGADFAFTLPDRFLIASRAITFYAGKLLFPYPLSFIYPRWQLNPASPLQWLPLVFCLAITAALAFFSFRNPQSAIRNRRGPLVAWLFFVGTLVPALGFVDVYPMRFSFVADHFQYLAGIGVVTLVVAGGTRLMRSRPGLAPAVWLVLLVACFGLTAARAAVLADAESLWRDTVAKNPSSWMARTNLATLLMDRAPADWAAGDRRRAVADLAEAEAQLRSAHDLSPGLPEPLMDLGRVAELRADFPTAADWMRQAIAIDPAAAEPHFHLAAVLARAGNTAAAVDEYRRTLDLDPRHVPALVNLGALLADQGHPDQAVPLYRRALAADPDATFARTNLGNALMVLGDARAAADEYRQALRTDPGFAPAEQGLRRALAATATTEPAR